MRVWAILLYFCVGLSAQPSAGNLSISGIVVNRLTGEPVKYAVVTAVRAMPVSIVVANQDQDNLYTQVIRRATTGPAGEFQLIGLPAGKYTVQARKPGFREVEFSENRLGLPPPIEVESSVADLRVPIDPLGTMEGKLVDRNGTPVSGANITCVQYRISEGSRQPTSKPGVLTDEGKQPRQYMIDTVSAP